MAKPDPILLDPARYPFHYSVETRFSDLDLNSHINNVALVGLLEEGRVRYNLVAGNAGRDEGVVPMVASLAVEFIGQSYFPDPLDIHVAAGKLGRTSYVIYQLASQGDRIVAFAEAVLVCIGDGRPAELPAGFRKTLEAWSISRPV